MEENVIEDIINARTVNACIYENLDSFKNFTEDNAYCESDDILILSLNVRSCNKHFDELMVILNYYRFKFDIIILTETWMDESSCGNVSMNGYSMIVNKESKNQNDGVIVFVNERLAVCHEEVEMHGATCVKVDVTFGRERLSLLAVYRSPSADLALFIDDLDSYLDTRCRDRAHWLVGDINCCILPETTEYLSQRYLDVLYGAGFTSLINVPTRVTHLSKSCIDHIFTDSRDINKMSPSVIKTEMTDHYFTAVLIKFNHKNKNNFCFSNKTSSFFDNNEFGRLVSYWDWQPVLRSDNVDTSSSLFIDNLQSIISASTKLKKIPSKEIKIKSWITAGLIKSIRFRDKLSKQLKKQPFNPVLKNATLITETF